MFYSVRTTGHFQNNETGACDLSNIILTIPIRVIDHQKYSVEAEMLTTNCGPERMLTVRQAFCDFKLYLLHLLMSCSKKTMKLSPGSATIKDRSPHRAPRGGVERKNIKQQWWHIKNGSLSMRRWQCYIYEPRHDKTNKVCVRQVWSRASLSVWRKLGSLATLWAHSEASDQTGRMTKLIWVFAGRTVILLVLSCRGSYTDRTKLT